MAILETRAMKNVKPRVEKIKEFASTTLIVLAVLAYSDFYFTGGYIYFSVLTFLGVPERVVVYGAFLIVGAYFVAEYWLGSREHRSKRNHSVDG